MAHIRKHPAAARPQRRGVVSQARTRAVIPAGDTRQRALVCERGPRLLRICAVLAELRTDTLRLTLVYLSRATRRELCIDLEKIGYGWGLALELCSMKGRKFSSMCSQ
ncbi:hypothetical protein C8J57DRAFT_1222512 [Mycena rebaudengoi]|nr:hypothetical protein C8J57DRAFT_1222512 [Mycena rebaudengoi]